MLTEPTKELLSHGFFPSVLVFLFIGGVIGITGFIMWYKKKIFPLNSVEWAPINEEKLTSRIGITFMIIGFVIIALPFCFYWIGSIMGIIIGIIIVSAIAYIALSFALDRFEM